MRIKRGRFKAETKDYLIKENIKRKQNLLKYKRINSFNLRNNKINKNGYLDYKKYLQSPEWKILRKKIIDYYKRCLFCLNSNNLNVHHMFYSKDCLDGKSTKGMILICQDCHEQISKIAINKNMPDLIATIIFSNKKYPGIDLRPYYKNGFFKEKILWKYTNVLNATMKE